MLSSRKQWCLLLWDFWISLNKSRPVFFSVLGSCVISRANLHEHQLTVVSIDYQERPATSTTKETTKKGKWLYFVSWNISTFHNKYSFWGTRHYKGNHSTFLFVRAQSVIVPLKPKALDSQGSADKLRAAVGLSILLPLWILAFASFWPLKTSFSY